MSNWSWPSSWQKEHLWMYLLCLGLEPKAAASSSGKAGSQVHLGVNMFDKPNKDAFYIVAHFLFMQLDATCSNELFRFCWPPLDKSGDAEFRKICFEWLKKISDESGSGFPLVVASLFLSPGGPKFIHLMYHFAKYVCLQCEKRNVQADCAYFPESVALKIQDVHKVVIRHNVAHSQFLQIVQKEDFVIKEYESKVWVLMKQIRDLRSERAKQEQLQTLDQEDARVQSSEEEVRSMWAAVRETLFSLVKEREVVDCILKGHIDQYSLDGTNTTVTVPRLLLDRIESEMHGLQIGNVYEAGKLNFITLLQLLNNTLKILKEERHQVVPQGLELDLGCIEEKAKLQADTLAGLKCARRKIREVLPSIKESIAQKERDWDEKWGKFLGCCPFGVNDENPALALLPAMVQLSFEPATEEAYNSSVFFQYPASLPDSSQKEFHIPESRGNCPENDKATSLSIGRLSFPCSPVALSEESWTSSEKINEDKLHLSKQSVPVEVLNLEACKVKALETLNDDQKSSYMKKQNSSKISGNLLQKAQDQLADQVASSIISGSSGAFEERDLDGILKSLTSNPFLTRKQIPRTPENLISDIRTSWRKAIQVEPSLEMQKNKINCVFQETTEESVIPGTDQVGDIIDSNLSSSCVPEPVNFSAVAEKIHNENLEGASVTSYSSITDMHGQWTGFADSEILERLQGEMKNVTESPDISFKNPGEFVYSSVGRSLGLSHKDCSPKKNKNLADQSLCLRSWHQETNSLHSTLSWNSSQMVGAGDSVESRNAIQFGILHETFPEEAGNISLNSSQGLEDDEALSSVEPKETECMFKEEKVEELETSLHQEHKMDMQAIRSRYEKWKKAVFENTLSLEREGVYKSPSRRFEKQKSESSLLSGRKEADSYEFFSPAEKVFSLDLESLKSPFRMSLGGRLLSLPCLAPFNSDDESILPTEPDDLLEVKGFQEGVMWNNVEESFVEEQSLMKEAVEHFVEF
ncbi:HAUS augmin-like complex subunit 6 isoform X2 [Latimeria chalumnae]|uniref:HAUS augmin-like complex subunit 6 isoform X2 n=1 Tax=Latimeria chalumnae TaxID=7897 RepID=UPI00313D1C93